MSKGQTLPMTLRLWGVRGSIPSPGPSTVRYGGNTPCVSLELGDEVCVVLDAGTGVRALGKYLQNKAHRLYVLITHEHWDHIQGFPFFAPIYQKDRKITMFPVHQGNKLTSLVNQMDGAHFPLTPEHLPSNHIHSEETPAAVLSSEGLTLTTMRMNHPGYCVGYRLEYAGRSVVYIPDNEIQPPGKALVSPEQLADFCRDADVLLHDSQLVDSDLPGKHGWGHSTVAQVRELAAAAGVKYLVLIHHDPDRTDDQLDEISRQCQEWAAADAPLLHITCGSEGMIMTIGTG